MTGPIGVFDSGYGGLTVLKEITATLPQYDYIYLGDNARAPYGTRSFESIYHYTLACISQLFEMGCPLVIIACNTASARALRTIQQKDLPRLFPDKRVLGIIRPTAEIISEYTKTNTVGILGTNGTIASESYVLEIKRFHPHIDVIQQACPMWVPLIENNAYLNEGAKFFIKQDIQSLLKQSDKIDTILLACTHYPLLMPIIRELTPIHINILPQGPIVAKSLVDYLNRHPEMENRCVKNKKIEFYTTDDIENFNQHATAFYGQAIQAKQLEIKSL